MGRNELEDKLREIIKGNFGDNIDMGVISNSDELLNKE